MVGRRKGCRSEGDSESNIRLADGRKALQSLYSVNRVEVTVFRVCEVFWTCLQSF